MHKRSELVCFIAMYALVGCFVATAVASHGQSGGTAPGRLIVVLKPGVAPETVARGHNVQPDAVYRHALNGFAGPATDTQTEDLKHDPNVRSVERDQQLHMSQDWRADFLKSFHTPNPPFSLEQQLLPTGIDRIDADLSATAKIDGSDERVDADIAIIDSGIDLEHPDLNVVHNVSFVPGTTDGHDDFYHGTGLAGVAAALDNSTGVVGVAPGARLWAVKVVNGGGASNVSWVLSGIDYVTAHASEIDVVEVAFEVTDDVEPSPAFDEALANSVNAGLTYVVSAGNLAVEVSSLAWLFRNDQNVILVSSLADSDGKGGGLGPNTCLGDADDTFSAFSDFGPLVDISAPGDCYPTTFPRGQYISFGGTSGASAHVAGVVALYKSKHPQASPDQVRAALLKEAKAQSDPMFGFSGDPDSSPEPVVYAGHF